VRLRRGPRRSLAPPPVGLRPQHHRPVRRHQEQVSRPICAGLTLGPACTGTGPANDAAMLPVLIVGGGIIAAAMIVCILAEPCGAATAGTLAVTAVVTTNGRPISQVSGTTTSFTDYTTAQSTARSKLGIRGRPSRRGEDPDRVRSRRFRCSRTPLRPGQHLDGDQLGRWFHNGCGRCGGRAGRADGHTR
jgi:hypothetical protein